MVVNKVGQPTGAQAQFSGPIGNRCRIAVYRLTPSSLAVIFISYKPRHASRTTSSAALCPLHFGYLPPPFRRLMKTKAIVHRPS